MQEEEDLFPADIDSDEPHREVSPGPRVLVAVMNSVRDFIIARDQGWYRIPLKRAPAQVAADYLAFYHTAAFPREKWGVSYYAPVRSYRIVTRAELLPEEAAHPRAADRYYRIDLGPLQELPHPIPSRHLRRIAFIPTTLSRLLSATEINDLWEGSLSAERLWAAFREAAIEAERRYQVGEGRDAYMVDFAIPCQTGAVAVMLGEGQGFLAPNWLVLYFTENQIRDDLPSCLDLVRRAIRERGGLRRK